MTLLGQHEYVEYSPLFIAMDPRVNPNAYAGYVYQSNDPRAGDATAWGMYSPTYAHSTIPVAQGKEHLHSATSALMSLQSEPSHTLEQYAHLRPGERPAPSRTSSDRQSREEWAASAQATSTGLRFDSSSHQGATFRNPGSYLQGAHRWASGSSSPSTPTPGSATDSSQPASYLSASGPPNSTNNFPPLVTHTPQPLHGPSSSTSSQFLSLHPVNFPSPATDRPQPTTNVRRRSSASTSISTSASASSSNTVTASTLGLQLADTVKAYHDSEDTGAKLARGRSVLNVSSEGSGLAREKPKLLTKDQKKRNHIFSEQKRRATIRHGYALLCEQVPSLRLAIAAAEADEAEHVADGEGRRRRRSRGRVSAADGERLDGRAGPRSESVVLVKTIDHLKELLATRQELVARVQELRAGDPGGDSPWERVWDGGTGLAPEGIDDDGEEDGDGESDEADGP